MVVGFPICTISLSCSINEIHGRPLFLKDHNFFYFGKYTLDQIVDAFTSCSQSEFWFKLCMWNVFNKVVHMVLGNVQGIGAIKASTMGRCLTRPHHFCGYNSNWLQMCMGHPCWQWLGKCFKSVQDPSSHDHVVFGFLNIWNVAKKWIRIGSTTSKNAINVWNINQNQWLLCDFYLHMQVYWSFTPLPNGRQNALFTQEAQSPKSTPITLRVTNIEIYIYSYFTRLVIMPLSMIKSLHF